MPIAGYGVLKCRAVDSKPGTESNPHYQVLVSDGELKYRIAVNVKSQESPSELLYFLNDNFQHPITEGLIALGNGFNKLDSKPGGVALDYIRGNLFDVSSMKPLAFDVPGPEGEDLNDLLGLYIQRAINSQDAVVYAFGQRFGPENTPDKVFHFQPENGIHDIHMNQSNSDRFQADDGVWQDGGLLIQFPSRNQWVAIFLAFQSQSFHTDDTTGHRIEESVMPTTIAGVRIVAALVNAPGDSKKSVSLLNTSPEKVDLTGWAIADSSKQKQVLKGISLDPGVFVTIPTTEIQLDSEGGIITLLNPQGLKIDGVSYTKDLAQKQGWTLVF